MSISELPSTAAQPHQPTRDLSSGSIASPLTGLASLKITVTLFALSIFLVLAGTLAQIDVDVWYVVHNYFRTFVARIDLQVFFPRAWEVPGTFPFPGGWLLGGCLSINLFAAHAKRFKVTGTGSALAWGAGLIVTGCLITYLVIRSGIDDTVESELSFAFCNGLWHALRAGLGIVTLGLSYVLAMSYSRTRGKPSAWLWRLGSGAAATLAVVVFWLFTHPEMQLDPAGLRILWQLIKSSAAGLVLIYGCHLVFGRRAGIVLLHSGIGLMMLSELLTGLHAEEGQMQIEEGQTVNFAQDIRSSELAIVDKSDPQIDRVTVIPADILQRAWEAKQPIEDPALPFALRVVEYFPNASVRLRQPTESSQATKGYGVLRVAESRAGNTGVATEQKADFPAVYIELLSKEKHASQGIYLLSPFLREEPLSLESKPYEIAFRMKRMLKPYSVKLIDFRHDRYVGTDTPKNYSSLVQLIDTDQNVDRKFNIWMNNPLRYGGDTLYQASFDKSNPRLTVLQVVTNSGWMIPYVSCMLVAIGMLAHFGTALYRFAQRKAAPVQAEASSTPAQLLANWHTPAVWIPTLVVLGLVIVIGGLARPKSLPATEMQIHTFGCLPVVYEGRVKPLDTFARNALTVLNGREAIAATKTRPKVPAIRWLLDVVTGSPAVSKYKMIRIENLDVLESLELKPRNGFRYSLEELLAHEEEYFKQFNLARGVAPDDRTLLQSRFMELGGKISLLNILQGAFSAPALRTDSLENVKEDFQILDRQIAGLQKRAALAVPPIDPKGSWVTLLEAERNDILDRVKKEAPNTATTALRGILDSYQALDVTAFNASLGEYKSILQQRSTAEQEYLDSFEAEDSVGQRKAAERLNLDRLQYEAHFNQFRPFYLSMVLYLIAFLLAVGSWLGWSTVLNRSAHWMLWFTFALHTFALIARIYISGRPPVTNLYSSAVFIGWAAVLFALVYERIYRIGIGNLLAGAVGFPTLFIAHNLAGDGDTFQVLQAVLDTQFWLATHVVCITFGYAATLVTGVLGLFYVLLVHLGGSLDAERRKQLTRMTYGTLCFATLFSFVGTVLGGLWADDSWGRFWGWDPKENGALIIVLWNALVLHARWGGMVKSRGFAVLAVFGNVVTAWSWFGVNVMGIGLHSYGFRSGMATGLSVFVASQLLIMFLGCLPDTTWRNQPADTPTTGET